MNTEQIPHLPIKKGSANPNGQREPISPPRPFFLMCSLRQRVAAWDSIREWESRQAPKCHTSSWILVLLALECLCLTEVALTRTMTVYHHVQTLLWMLKSICARSPASETDSLPELLSRSAATAVVASSGSPWPRCPSW